MCCTRKSQAHIFDPWFPIKVFQVCDPRRRPVWSLIMYLLMVLGACKMPNFSFSSPAILTSLYSGWSEEILFTNSICCLGMVGRPPLFWHFIFQRILTPARCHLITVSGFTNTRSRFHFLHILENKIQKKRSRFLMTGFF